MYSKLVKHTNYRENVQSEALCLSIIGNKSHYLAIDYVNVIDSKQVQKVLVRTNYNSKYCIFLSRF